MHKNMHNCFSFFYRLKLLKISDRRNFQSSEGIKRRFFKSVKKLWDIMLRVLRQLEDSS